MSIFYKTACWVVSLPFFIIWIVIAHWFKFIGWLYYTAWPEKKKSCYSWNWFGVTIKVENFQNYAKNNYIETHHL
jgi:hypothetical protein